MYQFQAPDMTQKMGQGLKLGGALYEFGKAKKVDKAREQLYMTEDGSPEQRHAYATLMAHDPDYLKNMAEERRAQATAGRDAEKHQWGRAKEGRDAAADTRKGMEDLSRVMVTHADTMLKMPEQERVGYVQQHRPGLEQMAPNLKPGFDKILADGRVSDDELHEFKRLMAAHGDAPNYQYKANQTGEYVGLNPKDPNDTVKTGVIARPTKPLVSIDNTSESAFAKEAGKKAGARADEMVGGGFTAQSQNSLLAQFESVLDQGVATGAMQDLMHPLKSILTDVGFDLEGVPPRELMNSLNTELALTQTPKTKGPISNTEMRLFIASVPGLARTPEGNRLILEFMRARNNAAIELGMEASKATTRQQLAEVSKKEYPMPADLMKRISQFKAPTRDIDAVSPEELGSLSPEELEAMGEQARQRMGNR